MPKYLAQLPPAPASFSLIPDLKSFLSTFGFSSHLDLRPPLHLSAWKNLTVLDLSFNAFNGSIPVFLLFLRHRRSSGSRHRHSPHLLSAPYQTLPLLPPVPTPPPSPSSTASPGCPLLPSHRRRPPDGRRSDRHRGQPSRVHQKCEPYGGHDIRRPGQALRARCLRRRRSCRPDPAAPGAACSAALRSPEAGRGCYRWCGWYFEECYSARYSP